MKIESEIIHRNGTTKTRIIARNDAGTIVDCDTITLESSVSRSRFSKKLAEATGNSAGIIERELLALLDQKPEPQNPGKPKADELLASYSSTSPSRRERSIEPPGPD